MLFILTCRGEKYTVLYNIQQYNMWAFKCKKPFLGVATFVA
jgi:hypothetical protein